MNKRFGSVFHDILFVENTNKNINTNKIETNAYNLDVFLVMKLYPISITIESINKQIYSIIIISPSDTVVE